jgi:hypothetical protein
MIFRKIAWTIPAVVTIAVAAWGHWPRKIPMTVELTNGGTVAVLNFSQTSPAPYDPGPGPHYITAIGTREWLESYGDSIATETDNVFLGYHAEVDPSTGETNSIWGAPCPDGENCAIADGHMVVMPRSKEGP